MLLSWRKILALIRKINLYNILKIHYFIIINIWPSSRLTKNSIAFKNRDIFFNQYIFICERAVWLPLWRPRNFSSTLRTREKKSKMNYLSTNFTFIKGFITTNNNFYCFDEKDYYTNVVISTTLQVGEAHSLPQQYYFLLTYIKIHLFLRWNIHNKINYISSKWIDLRFYK